MTIHRRVVAKWSSNGTLQNSFVPIVTYDFRCAHCNIVTRVIPDTIVDAECEMWRTRYEKVQALITEQVKKFNAKHGTDPFEIEWLETMHQLRQLAANFKDNGTQPL